MILVTGANGFVGKRIMELCRDTVACPSLRGLSEEDIRRIVGESGADTVIHTAAISDIGTCEANPEASYIANVQIPIYLAKAAKDAKLICFSSDQVYSGMEEPGPYTEDRVNPGNTYARHKLEMERRILDMDPDAVMLRAEWMYDYGAARPNYFMNVWNAREEIVFSSRQYRGITYVREVARNMEKVAKLPGGAYNFGSETDKSMYEVTEGFLTLLGKRIRLVDAPPKHNLWMNCEKARKYGVDFQSVEEALKTCATEHGLIHE